MLADATLRNPANRVTTGSVRPTYIARILDAGTTVIEEDLYGWVVLVARDGAQRRYLFVPPRHSAATPPGWESIVTLTGLGDDVLDAWTDSLTNHVVVKVFDRLSTLTGIEYLAREVLGFNERVTVDLTSLSIERSPPPARTSLPAIVDPPTRTRVSGLELRYLEETPDPVVVLETAAGAVCAISVPDELGEQSPDAWWILEVITEVPASRIAAGWSKAAGLGTPRVNTLLDVVVRQARAMIVGLDIGVEPSGALVLDDLLAAVVRPRWHQGHLPCLYVDTTSQRVISRTWRLLFAVYGHVIFRYHAEPGARLGQTSIVVSIDDRLKLDILDDKPAVKGALMRAINYGLPGPRKVRAIEPPDFVVSDVLKYAHPSTRPIDGLVRIPTLRPDGAVHQTPGYDPLSRLWYAPDSEVEPIPTVIRSRELQRAVAALLTPFRQFPFVDESAIAGTIACLIEQVVRPMITGPRPLYAFDAPAFRGTGSGKTLIPRAIGALISGRPVSVTPWPDTSEEVAKVITALLMEGTAFVIFDNLMGTVDHPHLAALVTNTHWTVRTLSTMRAPQLLQQATWAVTLNGATFSRDMARRSVLIRLNAGVADAHKRKGFDIEDLVPWIIEHRAHILRAALILARSWVLAGSPKDPGLTIGTFESWARVVGGILHHAGICGLSQAIGASGDRDVETVEYEHLVERWIETFGDRPVSAGQIMELADHYALFARALEGSRTKPGRARRMAEIVGRMVGHQVGGVTVRRREAKLNGHTMYELTRTSSATTFAPPSAEVAQEVLPS